MVTILGWIMELNILKLNCSPTLHLGTNYFPGLLVQFITVPVGIELFQPPYESVMLSEPQGVHWNKS